MRYKMASVNSIDLFDKAVLLLLSFKSILLHELWQKRKVFLIKVSRKNTKLKHRKCGPLQTHQ